MAEIGDTFKPGQKAPHSGIYDIVHDRGHRVQHQVTVLADEHLPPCRGCGKGVRFRLAHRALHISEVEELQEQAA